MTQMKIKKPSGLKRALAAVIDLFVTLVLFFVLYAFVVQPLYYNHTSYKAVAKEYYGGLQETGLYEYNEQTMYCTITTFEVKKGEEVTPQRYYDFYEPIVYSYYKNNEQLNTYTKFKEDSKLFNEDGTIKASTSNSSLQNFYAQSIQKAVSEIYLKDETNKQNLNTLQNYSTQMIIFSALPAFLFFYVGVPLLLNNGQTLGKKMFNLRVASTKKGFKLPIGSMLLRQFLVIVVGYVASIFTMFITPILFLVLFLSHREGKSLDDLLASTIVYENVEPIEGDKHTILIQIEDVNNNTSTQDSSEPEIKKLTEDDIIDQATLEQLNQDNSQGAEEISEEENVK